MKSDEEIFIEAIRAKPKIYFNDVLEATLWQKQEEVLDEIVHRKRIVVPSGHALGKDFLGGGLPLWWLSAYRPSIVIMTAPTDRQVKDVMWGELTTQYHRAAALGHPIGGKLITKNLYLGDKWYCTAFTTKETKGQTGKFSGYHAPNVLIIVSEAQALDDSLYEQMEGILASENCRIILLGNPVRTAGYFAAAIRGSDYHTIRFDCEDNPNYLQKKTVIPGLASYEWVEKMKKLWGLDSPQYYSRIKGLLPLNSVDACIDYAVAESRIKASILYKYNKKRRIVACDPASYGDDDAVIYVMEEGDIIDQDIIKGKRETTEIAGRCIIMREKYDCFAIAVDTVGEGAGVRGDLLQAGENVIEIKGSYAQASGVPSEYLNMRAWMWKGIGPQMLKDGYASLNDDPELLEELTTPCYYVNGKGQFQVESKDDIKLTLHRSPNKAEAYLTGLMALHLSPDLTDYSQIRSGKKQKTRRNVAM
jgi:hypothetical protein